MNLRSLRSFMAVAMASCITVVGIFDIPACETGKRSTKSC
jgi:hypothetical protein